MSELRVVETARGASLAERGAGAAACGLAERLRFAVAPTFALMAVLTALDESPMDRLCSAASAGSLNGMVLMYLLMSAFHAPPWLKLISSVREPVSVRGR